MADTVSDAASPAKPAAPETQVRAQQQSAPGNDALPGNAIPLDTLEVPVTFELDRRLMSIAEIAALAPGYTFTLAKDPTGPVTIRVNGICMGTGRLVDLGGTLGVQLVSLERDK